jgi:hypothetical protein
MAGAGLAVLRGEVGGEMKHVLGINAVSNRLQTFMLPQTSPMGGEPNWDPFHEEMSNNQTTNNKKERKVMNNNIDGLTTGTALTSARRRWLKKLSVGLALMVMAAGALCVTGFGPAHYRLGGAWVGGRSGFLWSALQTPLDPSGQTAAARPILKHFDTQFAGLLAAFGADNLSDAIGEARMISQDTARWTLLAHAQATPHQPGELLRTMAIIVYSGTWKYTSQDTAVLTYTVNVYPASADGDGDGYPDANAQPVLTIPDLVDNAKRVPIL